MTRSSAVTRGFTLIEMSIALVIVGFLTGGVLVGQDLIKASVARSQISDIEKYQTAVNAFRAKFGYLPGDFSPEMAAKFGFITRYGCRGNGDGNGLIEGVNQSQGIMSNGTCNNSFGGNEPLGEPEMFWIDLSKANYVAGFNNFSNGAWYYPNSYNGAQIATALPSARIAAGTYVYVWSDSADGGNNDSKIGNSLNYFGIAALTDIAWVYSSTPGIPVKIAHMIDNKLDDGLPQSGNVRTIYSRYINGNGPAAKWSNPEDITVTSSTDKGYTSAISGSASTCYDNGGVAGNVMKYSINQNRGEGVNCALSFKFQ